MAQDHELLLLQTVEEMPSCQAVLLRVLLPVITLCYLVTRSSNLRRLVNQPAVHLSIFDLMSFKDGKKLLSS